MLKKIVNMRHLTFHLYPDDEEKNKRDICDTFSINLWSTERFNDVFFFDD